MNRYEHTSGGTNEVEPGSAADRRLSAHPDWTLAEPDEPESDEDL